MLRDPHVGDRDPRTEDRQLLLDALMAADRPPDRHLHRQRRADEHAAPAGGAGRRAARRDRPHRARRTARRRATRARPPSAAAVRPAQLHARRARARPALELRPRHARRRAGARRRARRAAAVPRRPAAAARARRVVELDDLVRFVEHPVRAFLRRRLGISVGELDDEVDDALPVELDDLEQWRVGQRLLEARLGGRRPRTAALPAEIARGDAAARPLGEPVIDELRPMVEQIVRADAALPATRRARLRRRHASRCRTAGRSPAPSRASAATLLRTRHLLARRAHATGSPPGCGCSRSTAAHPERRVPGGDCRAGELATRRAARRRSAAADDRTPQARARAPRRALDLYDRGHARAAAARLQDLGRLRAAAREAATRRGRARGVGVRRGTSPRRTASPSTSSCSAAC